MAFWALTYIMHLSTLYDTIHAETLPATNVDGTFNAEYIVTKCLHLQSLWLEILRLVNGASAARASCCRFADHYWQQNTKARL